MREIGSTLSNFFLQRGILEDVLTTVARIFGGLITALIFILVLNKSHINIDKIIHFESKLACNMCLLIYLLLGSFLYFFGLLAKEIFDLLTVALGEIFYQLSKLEFKRLKICKKIIKQLHDFFRIPNPLTKISDDLEPSYKTTLIREINKHFKIRGSTSDLFRLSKKLCEENNLIKFHREGPFFDLYKIIFIDLIILSYWCIFNKEYILSVVLIILAYGFLTRLRNRTLELRIAYLDLAYSFLLRNKRKSKK